MIISLTHNAVPITDGLVEHLKSITVRPYQPLTAGYTHTYKLKGLSGFTLMQGVAVPKHSDGIAAYRPMVILYNPRDNYTIRGIGQSWNVSQSAGTVLVLDINMEHEVHDRDPAARLGSWLALAGGLVPYGDGTEVADIQGAVDGLMGVVEQLTRAVI